MPTFDFCCPGCGEIREVFVRRKEGPPTCSACGMLMRKLPSAPAFSLKGGGWAKDGYSKKDNR